MSLTASNENLFNSLDSSSSSSSSNVFSNNNANTNSNSIWSKITNMSWLTWVLIFFVLAILGFNIFTYLAEGTELVSQLSQNIINLFNQFTSWFSGLFGNNVSETAKQTVNVSATGAKAGIDVAANTTTGVIDKVSSNTNNTNPNINTNTNTNTNPNTNTNNTNTNNSNTNNTYKPNQVYTTNPGFPLQTQNTGSIADNTLNKALNQATVQTSVQADDSYSSIQASKTSSKSGWCFIGEDRGTRSCMQVGANDVCMSGDIYPTNDVCINPRLRA